MFPLSAAPTSAPSGSSPRIRDSPPQVELSKEMAEDCCSFQLIHADRVFNTSGLEEFAHTVNLDKCGISYDVVSIIGPQNSGKSTLLNLLYKANFKEMDKAKKCQTTKGIWMAKGVDNDPMTLILDVEGTDSGVRGDDDKFEKESTLFAFAMSDIILINLWYHNVGLRQASCKSLLKIVFQVLSQLFGGGNDKKTLLFIIRDNENVSPDLLKEILTKDIKEIWDALTIPETQKDSAFQNFSLHVEALTSYVWDADRFKEQVTGLKQKIYECISLSRNQSYKVPANALSRYSQDIWGKILSEGQDLNVLSEMQQVLQKSCEKIAGKKFASLKNGQAWHQLEEAAKTQVVSGFGQKLETLLNECLSGFDSETEYYESVVKSGVRNKLEEQILQLLYPAYETILRNLSNKIQKEFKQTIHHGWTVHKFSTSFCKEQMKSSMDAFDKGCPAINGVNWDVPNIRNNLLQLMEAYGKSCREARLTICDIKHKVDKELAAHLRSCFAAADHDTWEKITKFVNQKIESAKNDLSSTLNKFDIDQSLQESMLGSLKPYAVNSAKTITKDEAKDDNVLMLMRNGFLTVLQSELGSEHKSGKQDTEPAIKKAYSASLKVLDVLSKFWLDDDSLDIGKNWKEPSSEIILDCEKIDTLWDTHKREMEKLPLVRKCGTSTAKSIAKGVLEAVATAALATALGSG